MSRVERERVQSLKWEKVMATLESLSEKIPPNPQTLTQPSTPNCVREERVLRIE